MVMEASLSYCCGLSFFGIGFFFGGTFLDAGFGGVFLVSGWAGCPAVVAAGRLKFWPCGALAVVAGGLGAVCRTGAVPVLPCAGGFGLPVPAGCPALPEGVVLDGVTTVLLLTLLFVGLVGFSLRLLLLLGVVLFGVGLFG